MLASPIKEHFSNRSVVYDTYGTWINNEDILSSMIMCLPDACNRKLDIIDLGAGTGAVCKYILNNYSNVHLLTAVDICEEMLNKIANPDIVKCVASLESLPFNSNYFDVAVSRQCLHYIECLDYALLEIKRILKKNGIFILSQIVPLENQVKNYWENLIRFRQPLRKNYFSETEWIKALAEHGFKSVKIERFSHRGSVLKWGKKYNIIDRRVINEHKRLLLESPPQFIETYNIIENGDDVFYDLFWFVAKFKIEYP